MTGRGISQLMTGVHRHGVASTSPTSTTLSDQEEACNPGRAYVQTSPPVPSRAARAEPILSDAPPLIHGTKATPPPAFLCSRHVCLHKDRARVCKFLSPAPAWASSLGLPEALALGHAEGPVRMEGPLPRRRGSAFQRLGLGHRSDPSSSSPSLSGERASQSPRDAWRGSGIQRPFLHPPSTTQELRARGQLQTPDRRTGELEWSRGPP